MTTSLPRLTLFVLVFAGPASALENDDATVFDVAGAYEQILADYQRIAATNSATARAAAGRLVTFAYRNVIDRATEIEELDADDLYALGACHEGLGNSTKRESCLHDR